MLLKGSKRYSKYDIRLKNILKVVQRGYNEQKVQEAAEFSEQYYARTVSKYYLQCILGTIQYTGRIKTILKVA